MASPQYVTVAELGRAYDRRLLETLATDAGTSGSLVNTNTILSTAIERASEDILMAALRGGRYSEADILQLSTDDRWSLKGLVCDLAVYHLHKRRQGNIPESVKDSIQRALELLDKINDGQMIFPIDKTASAGQMSIKVIQPTTRKYLNMASDEPFFPTRNPTTY